MNYTIKVYEINKPANFFTCNTMKEFDLKINQVKQYFGYIPNYSTVLIPAE